MKDSTAILVLAPIMVFFAIASTVGGYARQQETQPEFLANAGEGNITYLAWYYGGAFPHTTGRGYAGDPHAGIVMIAFLDPASEASRMFMRDTYPLLRRGFIENGTLRFYGRIPVSRSDVRDRTERFLYALTLSCVNTIDPTAYGRVYADSIGTPLPQLQDVVREAGIPEAAYDECMLAGIVPDEDVMLTEKGMTYLGQRLHVGFGGSMMTTYDGIPSITTLRRTLRSYAINLGA